MYQEEAIVYITRGCAKRIRKFLGGTGFITHVDEVSNEPIGKEDQFRIVLYHPDVRAGVEELIKSKMEIQWKRTK